MTWRDVGTEVEYAFPAIVIADRGDDIILYQAHDSIAKRMAGRRHGGDASSQLAPPVWAGQYEDYIYSGPNVLRAYSAGDGFSVIRSLNSDLRSVSGWYINIEKPWTRTVIGFDSRDLVVDVRLVDGQWTLEDEDELRWALDDGVLSSEDERFARSSIVRALERAEHRTGPFSITWSDFLPDPNWPTPVVHESWQQLAQ